MTQREFAELGQDEYQFRANRIAENITIRSYIDGNSNDEVRPTTEIEKRIIKELAYAAMLAYGYRNDGNVDSVLDMAEFALHRFIPEANSYDTLYIPLKKEIGLW